MNYNRAIGNIGEDMASAILKQYGYDVIDRNYRCKLGEIDIIAIEIKSRIISFIEVKTRTGSTYGYPVQSISGSKIRHIRNVANIFLSEHKEFNSYNVSFDVFEIETRFNTDCF